MHASSLVFNTIIDVFSTLYSLELRSLMAKTTWWTLLHQSPWGCILVGIWKWPYPGPKIKTFRSFSFLSISKIDKQNSLPFGCFFFRLLVLSYCFLCHLGDTGNQVVKRIILVNIFYISQEKFQTKYPEWCRVLYVRKMTYMLVSTPSPTDTNIVGLYLKDLLLKIWKIMKNALTW